jgi:pimeloyl-ACP methyl ester carboxylesterase
MAPAVIYTDDEVEITYAEGQTDSAVVVFTGLGFGTGGLQVPEFRRTLSGQLHHIYFVIERARHWYNSTLDRITDALNTAITQTRVTTLGNSMGGFGALAFARRLPHCVRAIAFAPQSAMDPAIVPWDTRFTEFTKSVKRWNGLDATREIISGVEYFMVLGALAFGDLRHAARFAVAPNVTIYTIEGYGHEVSGDLSRVGLLKALTQALVNATDPRREVADALRGVEYRLGAPDYWSGDNVPGRRRELQKAAEIVERVTAFYSMSLPEIKQMLETHSAEFQTR